MNIAICEDKFPDYIDLEYYIKKYCNTLHLNPEIQRFETGASFLNTFEQGRFQIVFMDIFLGAGDAGGLEAAREICRLDGDCKIIFTTSSKDFAVDGFELGAVHYIVKPVIYEKVQEALGRCRDIIVRNARYITVISNRSEKQIPLKDILYIETLEKRLLIHTYEGIVPTYMSLEQIEAGLDSAFLRCHKCYVVNLAHVRSLHDDFLMKNGDTVLVRKRDTKAIREAYAQYHWDRVRRDL